MEGEKMKKHKFWITTSLALLLISGPLSIKAFADPINQSSLVEVSQVSEPASSNENTVSIPNSSSEIVLSSSEKKETNDNSTTTTSQPKYSEEKVSDQSKNHTGTWIDLILTNLTRIQE